MTEKQNTLIKQTVRSLRRKSTKSENILWKVIRNRKLKGKKFQRQFPIRFELLGQERFLIADFYCHESKLVVEIDGPIHDRQKDYDELRTHCINMLGIKVIRFKNEEIDNDINEVIQRIFDNM